jgi:hypothetical protein
MGEQIFGLGSTSGGSQEDCARKCCNDPTCNVYSYCPANSLSCGKQAPSSICMTGNSDSHGNCSDGGGAEWCNWYSYARTSQPLLSPYNDCTKVNPPTSSYMANPPRLPTGVPKASGRAGDGWGINFHQNEWSGKDSEYDMVASAFRIVRLDLTWQTVENKANGCGIYNFSAYDAADAAFRARGVQPLYILDYWSDCYTQYKNGCADMQCAEAFGAFGAAAMEHFPGAIMECQNEPQGPPFYPNSNGTLVAYMCYAVRSQAAAANKLNYFIGPTTSWFDYNFIMELSISCAWNAFHAWSIHPYTSGNPESRLYDMSQLSDYLYQSSGSGKGTLSTPPMIVSSEWGYVSCPPGECNDETNVNLMTQGKFIARMQLSQTMVGAAFSIWYDFKNDPYGPTDSESHFGTVNGTLLPDPVPYQPLPGYIAALTAQNTVGNGSFTGRLQAKVVDWDANDEDVFVLQFEGANIRRSGFPSYAVWTNISICSAEGPRTPCGTADDVFSCMKAGCCFDEGVPDGEARCFQEPFYDDPLRVSFSLPPTISLNACFSVIDTWGNEGEAQYCAEDGVLLVNVTDGPVYLI